MAGGGDITHQQVEHQWRQSTYTNANQHYMLWKYKNCCYVISLRYASYFILTRDAK
jgi:hypothetical protein